MTVLDFHEQLHWSEDTEDEAAWLDFYGRVWPDLLTTTKLDAASAWQTRGVDRVVYTKGGRSFTIDEKKRRKDYGDFLAEVWSVCDRAGDRVVRPEKKGWAIDPDKTCDFIAYAVPGAIRLIPFESLRLAMGRFGRGWCARPGCYPKWAQSRMGDREWWTASVSVPWDELWRGIGKAARFDVRLLGGGS